MGSLNQQQVKQFEDQGFLVVKGLFDPKEDLDPVIHEYEGVLDRLADKLFASGKISSRYDDLPFGKRLINIQQEVGKGLVQNFDFSLPRPTITEETPMWVGPAIFNALSNPRLLDAIESLIGSEILVNPVHHVRLKMPESAMNEAMRDDVQVRRTFWHQDNGVVLPIADQTDMITVWYPLWDAPITSGPLQVVPNFHRNGLVDHCPAAKNGGGTQIPQQTLDEQPVLSLPMKRGDVLFMHKHMPHCSLPNLSDNVRWSFDLRYNPVGQPTGRDVFPGFVARSRKAPETELHDSQKWAESWYECRSRLAAKGGTGRQLNRWSSDAPMCA